MLASKIVEADVHPVQEAAAHQLLRRWPRRSSFSDDHVIAVPAHAAADVQQHLGEEREHGEILSAIVSVGW